MNLVSGRTGHSRAPRRSLCWTFFAGGIGLVICGTLYAAVRILRRSSSRLRPRGRPPRHRLHARRRGRQGAPGPNTRGANPGRIMITCWCLYLRESGRFLRRTEIARVLKAGENAAGHPCPVRFARSSRPKQPKGSPDRLHNRTDDPGRSGRSAPQIPYFAPTFDGQNP
jgi:hypothetical protein